MKIMRGFLLLLPLLFFACSDPGPDVDFGDGGVEYFPLQIGNFWIYDVDSVYYDDFTNDSTHHVFNLMERVESSYIDGEGRVAYRIERYRRDSLTQPWTIVGVRSAVISSSMAEKLEENVRYIKLVFPLKKNMKWDGNAMNILPAADYLVKSLHEPLSLGGLQFDSTCTVQQADYTTLISIDLKMETYAKGVGMVHRRFKELRTSITGVIEQGFDYSYTLTDYGTR